MRWGLFLRRGLFLRWGLRLCLRRCLWEDFARWRWLHELPLHSSEGEGFVTLQSDQHQVGGERQKRHGGDAARHQGCDGLGAADTTTSTTSTSGTTTASGTTTCSRSCTCTCTRTRPRTLFHPTGRPQLVRDIRHGTQVAPKRGEPIGLGERLGRGRVRFGGRSARREDPGSEMS